MRRLRPRLREPWRTPPRGLRVVTLGLCGETRIRVGVAACGLHGMVYLLRVAIIHHHHSVAAAARTVALRPVDTLRMGCVVAMMSHPDPVAVAVTLRVEVLHFETNLCHSMVIEAEAEAAAAGFLEKRLVFMKIRGSEHFQVWQVSLQSWNVFFFAMLTPLTCRTRERKG